MKLFLSSLALVMLSFLAASSQGMSSACPDLSGSYSCITEESSEPPLMLKVIQYVNPEGFTVYENHVKFDDWVKDVVIADGVTRYLEENEGGYHIQSSSRFWCEGGSVHVDHRGTYTHNGQPGEFVLIGQTYKNSENQIIQEMQGTYPHKNICTPLGSHERKTEKFENF